MNAARKIAKKRAKLAAKGKDYKDKVKRHVPHFRTVAQQVLAKEANGRSEKTSSNIKSLLERHAYPVIGDKPVNRVTSLDLYLILAPLYENTISPARKLSSQIRRIFRYCLVVLKCIRRNPLTKALLDEMPANTTPEGHQPSLPYLLLPQALKQIDQASADIALKACTKAIALTGLRLGAATKAEWNEFSWKEIQHHSDWSKAGWDPVDWDEVAAGSTKVIIWTIPAERMKSQKGHGKAHRVPVSDALLQILLQMRELGDDAGRNPKFVFPSNRTHSHISGKSITNFMERLDLPSDTQGRYAVAHGFRATIRNFSAEAGVPYDVAEMTLAHELPKVVRAYLRSDLPDDRLRLMQVWSDYSQEKLPPDWKWGDLNPETLTLIEQLKGLLAEAEQRAISAEKHNRRMEKQIVEMNAKLDGLLVAT